MGRKARARARSTRRQIDASFDEADILTNCRNYPNDEAPAAYKDFNEVLRSGEAGGPGERGGAAEGAVRDQGWGQGG